MFLVLIRHAKSSWENPFNDKLRPLSNRGKTDVLLVFNELKKHINFDFELYSSTATRASDTAKAFGSIFQINESKINFLDSLYTFNENEFEKQISLLWSKNCIVFGHNPAITEFVNKYGDYYIENVPTCGVVIIKFDNTEMSKGKIIKTIFPKDLK